MSAGYYWRVVDHSWGKVYRVYACNETEAIDEVRQFRGEWIGDVKPERWLTAEPDDEDTDQRPPEAL